MSYLLRHIKTVLENKKDFTCNICNKQFEHSSNLVVHEGKIKLLVTFTTNNWDIVQTHITFNPEINITVDVLYVSKIMCAK
jgi:hypothetical protein